MSNQIMGLPQGYSVEISIAVGATYRDENQEIVFQHPYDNLLARECVWRIWTKKEQEKKEIGSSVIQLPDGWEVKKDTAVGYGYYDENGQIVFQHPYDDPSARISVWRIWVKRNQEKIREQV